MNWKEFWDQQATLNSNPQAQVGRVKKGLTVQAPVVEEITDRISTLLDVQPSDHLLDICCGNGILTLPLASKCHSIVGVDISTEQLALAQLNASKENIRYQLADAIQLVQNPALAAISPPDGYDKINLYFSFQYLDTFNKGKNALQGMLHLLKNNGLILLGDVPEQQHFHTFYPTFKSKVKYHLKRLLHKNDMGKFWSEKELQQICQKLGCEIKRLKQPPHFPYSDYRCDYLIKKTAN